MRIPLATTLRNRTQSTDTGARLLNAVVDSKKRVAKRPSLVGSFEVATAGAGLGLYVRSTPHAPDDGSDEELIAIVGSSLITSPSVFFNTTHTLTSVNVAGNPVVFGMNLTVGAPTGSISPTTYNGATIRKLFAETDTPNTVFAVSGDVSQNFFTSIKVGAITLTSASADSFSSGGGQTSWGWNPETLVTSTGAVLVMIV